ncbi:hypothetical protein JIP62_10325 [Brevundimonas vitis]|uniref:Flagellar hook-length control protein FliK n=1 Tax=Brevundimonas vitisensis TaxID=2800818 RepID=A0ABX7BLY2_9CAUL|nr:hypothetical protein [Brevundimonas vitisensis]QQQ17728.1 hypothetical protein JIP62_10325 [Brevundimonas vitisensis]
MSSIRPDLPAMPTVRPEPGAAVRSAQAAFFRAALAQAEPSVAVQQTPQPSPLTAAPTRSASPERDPRPGSLLDIRV